MNNVHASWAEWSQASECDLIVSSAMVKAAFFRITVGIALLY